MIEIRSLLRTPDGGFVPVDEATVPPADLDYVEGAIELTVHGRVILDRALWDYLPELWAYLASAVEEYASQGRGGTSFPDQPVTVELRDAGPHRTAVSVHGPGLPRRVAATDTHDLLHELYHAGEQFFRRMDALAGISDPQAVERLRRAAAMSRGGAGGGMPSGQ